MKTLTHEEIKILDEALDSWVSSNLSNRLFGSLLTAMLKDDKKPELTAKLEQSEKEADQKAQAERDVRKRQAVMLKAKLYEMDAELPFVPLDAGETSIRQ
jgi:hypothetical protein